MTNIGIGNQNITYRSHVGGEEIIDVELLMTTDALQGVFYTVGLAIDDKDTSIVHLQPDILRLVDNHVIHTVVETRETAGNTRLVVVEMVAVEA